MRILLIPGFWLNAASWAPITARLEGEGHDVTPLTLPGMSSVDDDRRDVTWADHVAAVVAEVDRSDEPLVIVGHSAGGALAHAAVDARPERVTRVVYVDSWPLGEGDCVNSELPLVNGEIPLPDWSVFPPEDLVGMDEERRAHLRAVAVPVPRRVASYPQVLRDPRRYDVPITVIACEFTAEQVREWIGVHEPAVRELAAVKDVSYVELPTGHWPQFTRPEDLAEALIDIVGVVS